MVGTRRVQGYVLKIKIFKCGTRIRQNPLRCKGFQDFFINNLCTMYIVFYRLQLEVGANIGVCFLQTNNVKRDA
jgi:hypothetical protein